MWLPTPAEERLFERVVDLGSECAACAVVGTYTDVRRLIERLVIQVTLSHGYVCCVEL